MGRILAFASVAEIGTGFALILAPAMVIRLLIGTEELGAPLVIGRCFGVALLALGTACRPRGERSVSDLPAFRGMLIYNVLIALYLAYLGAAVHLGGLLLWPAVVTHAVVTLLLVAAWRSEKSLKSPAR